MTVLALDKRDSACNGTSNGQGSRNNIPVPPAAEGEVPNEWNTGINGYVYYVCNYLGAPLTQLPAVTPVQVKAARSIKKFLTGRLASQVSSYPVFPGTEAHYLRSQVSCQKSS